VQYSPYKSSVRDDTIDSSSYSRQNLYKNTHLEGSRYEQPRREGQNLKRKNINCIENPFFRKNLIPTAPEASFTEQSYASHAESRKVRLFESRPA
jgi:hypothetical protein